MTYLVEALGAQRELEQRDSRLIHTTHDIVCLTTAVSLSSSKLFRMLRRSSSGNASNRDVCVVILMCRI